ncbi:hypothetical protein EZS27_007202 [termite gut metagenome]|uniref:Lipoprotein n=1 Tax=termite gut metagenome TaxID=433724 RepID=A0A5J4SGI1_9ZZZZ
MKKIFLAIALCGFLFASCGNKSNKNNTHTHEDGSVHTDHSAAEQPKPVQESFEVKADSSATVKADSLKTKEKEHTHDHGESKSHKH